MTEQPAVQDGSRVPTEKCQEYTWASLQLLGTDFCLQTGQQLLLTKPNSSVTLVQLLAFLLSSFTMAFMLNTESIFLRLSSYPPALYT